MSFLFRASNIVTVSLPFGNLPPVVCKKAPDNFYSTHELINNDRKKNSRRRIRSRDSRSDIFVLFAGQLNDTQQELKENNELVVELQGGFLVLTRLFLVFSVFLTIPRQRFC